MGVRRYGLCRRCIAQVAHLAEDQMVLLLDSEESPKRCGATAFGKTVGLNGEESKHRLSLLNKQKHNAKKQEL